MAEFADINAKNISISYTSLELNCRFHPQVSCEEYDDLLSKSKNPDKLALEQKQLTAVCRENLEHESKLQKRHHNKHETPRSYVPDEIIWLNSQSIKTKQIASRNLNSFVFFEYYAFLRSKHGN